MPTLNLQQTELGPNRYRVSVSSDLPNLTLQHAVDFDYILTPADREAIRWYLEDYLDKPFEPNPKIAARTEQRMAEIGRELFERLFDGRRMIEWWGRAKGQLSQLRIEVSTSVAAATAIPWELLRDPVTDTPLVLEASEFVRSHRDADRQPHIPRTTECIRILLVICRPREDRDVPFRSVASQLVRGLNEDARRQVELTVLRPPTFEQLSRSLHEAKDAGRPFHLVHFDGHGLYADAEAIKDQLGALDALRFDAGRAGAQGFLLFEDPGSQTNSDYISGARIGRLLAETGTPVLVLNACRSAHAEQRPSRSEPGPADFDSVQPDGFAAQSLGGQSGAGTGTERAFGSLAQEVMDAGVAGVVAMRYNLWVVTATRFVYELYRNLVRGLSLGTAVSRGRNQLHAEPRRRIAFQEIPLQDWLVPVVFEAGPIRLLPSPLQTSGWDLKLGKQRGRETGADPLPPTPDIGFIGRDETLLALDRAFDRDRVVLLHAYAGSGKTAAAVEFARWYRDTGGLQWSGGNGPVLFTSFETYRPLAQVLGDFGDAFSSALEQYCINWGSLAELEQRRAIALQVMEQIPLLWIWDNLEPVAGFPEGAESAWSAAERDELTDFLRAAKGTRARFLLTSRRDERPWLGDLPTRIDVPPMPMAERATFAEALAHKQGKRLALADWRPLLRFTQGNPLTLLVVVRQALSEGLGQPDTGSEAIAAFVERLRAGEAGIEDEQSERRDRSLAASLQYGFERAFDEEQQHILALLVFFQGFVDVDVLTWMGDPEQDWSLPALRGWGRQGLTALLDRAAGLGLLEALGGGYYRIHPALPWFFRLMFERFYPEREPQEHPLPPGEGRGEGNSQPFPLGQPANERRERIALEQTLAIEEGKLAPISVAKSAVRTFCEAISYLGEYYLFRYGKGDREVISNLRAEEANLLHAWRLARREEVWDTVVSAMQGLYQLYDHTGRRFEWAALVAAVLPDFVDADDGPLPGRDEQWALVTGYRVGLAELVRDWCEAERLQMRLVEWSRARAAPLLERRSESLQGLERNRLRTLAVALEGLGNIHREQELRACTLAYEEALGLYEHVGDTAAEAVCALNLGNVYCGDELANSRDLRRAEHWYRCSLELCAENDRQGKARCLGQLGSVAWERSKDARTDGKATEFEIHVRAALEHYHRALDLLPADARSDLPVAHNQLGIIYRTIGRLDDALFHYQESIRLYDGCGDHYQAAMVRYNVAHALLPDGRDADALDYARAALQGLQRYGERAQREIDDAQSLIRRIQSA